jgi:hypothetical protein
MAREGASPQIAVSPITPPPIVTPPRTSSRRPHRDFSTFFPQRRRLLPLLFLFCSSYAPRIIPATAQRSFPMSVPRFSRLSANRGVGAVDTPWRGSSGSAMGREGAEIKKPSAV